MPNRTPRNGALAHGRHRRRSHRSTHTATAVDPATNADRGSVRIEATLAEYRRLIAWAERWPQRRRAMENADGLGRHLSRRLIARGEIVLDVPTTATARVRELSRGGRRKNDRIDAVAACVAALQGDARPVVSDEHCDALRNARRTPEQSVFEPNPHGQPAPRPAA
ncbi:transposase [Nocardia jiangsuensis]|uniref:Transposase n=1 Tax=Nocardia jiangsuensis TaxID=1691563 RepID=A0ABV8DP41_9NOCA